MPSVYEFEVRHRDRLTLKLVVRPGLPQYSWAATEQAPGCLSTVAGTVDSSTKGSLKLYTDKLLIIELVGATLGSKMGDFGTADIANSEKCERYQHWKLVRKS